MSGARRVLIALLTLSSVAAFPQVAWSRNLYVSLVGDGGADPGLIRGMSIGADGTPTGFTTAPPGGSPAQAGPASTAMTSDGGRLYVANYYSSNVTGYTVNAGGSLTRINTTATSTIIGPSALAIAPNDRYLYVVNNTSSSVSAFTIDGGGTLTPNGNTILPGADPWGAAVTPDGQHLYTADSSSNKVTGFNIAANGTITNKTDFSMPVGGLGATTPHGIAVSPDGQRLYTANAGSTSLSGFTIGPGGVLSPIGNFAATESAVSAIAISPDGGHVFVQREGANAKVLAFVVGPTGSLTQNGAAVPTGGDGDAALAVTPDGGFVYAGTSGPASAGRVAAFSLQASGTLAALTFSPFATTGVGPYRQSVVVAPNRGPTASFTATPASDGTQVTFDGSASSDPDGSVARYDWDFGDGQTLANGGPTPTHPYAAPSAYNVALTVTDNEGCSTQLAYTGQTASCNGSAAARATQTVTTSGASNALSLELSGKKRQALAKKGVKVDAECLGAACTLGLTATVKLPTSARSSAAKTRKRKPKSAKLKSIKGRQLVAGERTTIALKFPKKTYRQLQRALRGSKQLKLTVHATATASGATAKAERKIALVKQAKKRKR